MSTGGCLSAERKNVGSRRNGWSPGATRRRTYGEYGYQSPLSTPLIGDAMGSLCVYYTPYEYSSGSSMQGEHQAPGILSLWEYSSISRFHVQ